MDAATAGLIGSLGGVAVSALAQAVRESRTDRRKTLTSRQEARRAAYAVVLGATVAARLSAAAVRTEANLSPRTEDGNFASEHYRAILSQGSQAAADFGRLEEAVFLASVFAAAPLGELLTRHLAAADATRSAWAASIVKSNEAADMKWPSTKELRDAMVADLRNG